MDFGDSPDEAAFRTRFRAWLQENNPELGASSTSDDYWHGQAASDPLAGQHPVEVGPGPPELSLIHI